MRKSRFLAPWANDSAKRSIYHLIGRVVDRRFVFGDEEREQFRIYMRMYENFSGCEVLSYCLMSNHFHLLLEVPPMPEGGFSDAELLRRLRFLYSEMAVNAVAEDLRIARASGTATEKAAAAQKIHARFSYRFHNLSEFMKTLLSRFTRWFNRTHKRKGTLWEERFKSVIVESGTAARVMAAYIDLNPVRAGMVKNAENYRWSSYGEAIGGGSRGNGKKARSGLMRAIFSNREKNQTKTAVKKGEWEKAHREYRVLMDLALDRKPRKAEIKLEARTKKGKKERTGEVEMLGLAAMLRCRVRYFTEGAVIGSKNFVNEAYAASRERFGEKRKDGARKMQGTASAAAGKLWSLRDLRT